ncbi:MAG: hypothetical protein LAT84_12460 [Balneolia bacterium]|nr:hypothetical protein [Balneolia bacterium]
MVKTFLNSILVLALVLSGGLIAEANAQIAIAVAKDDNGSAIEWRVSTNGGSAWSTERAAREALESRGYRNVVGQAGGASRGHDLQSGYWVVVETNARMSDGRTIRSFGLGASSRSYSEAEERALSNLVQYFWSWRESHGYRVNDRGTF